MTERWMSWKTTNAQKEKELFILEYGSGDYGVAEMARRYGISRKTAYKWAGRYEREGLSGLEERSRAPLHHPNELSAEMVQRILETKGAVAEFWGSETALQTAAVGGRGVLPCGKQHWASVTMPRIDAPLRAAALALGGIGEDGIYRGQRCLVRRLQRVVLRPVMGGSAPR